MPGRKVMHPLTVNQVRIMAGNETFSSNINVFNKYALILTIQDDKSVTIAPYKNVEVTQVNGDPDFPNIFKIDDDGFKKYKTFLLRYNYKQNNTILEIKEELRMEYNEDDEAAETENETN